METSERISTTTRGSIPASEVFYIYHLTDSNIFTDEYGQVIECISDIIKTSDLYLYRHDPGYNIFPMKGIPWAQIEIIPVPDEICGWWRDEVIDLYFDTGDDLERIKRYEQNTY